MEKLYVEKTPGGILPDSHVVVCSCQQFKEKSTSKEVVLERFEFHQQYPEKAMRSMCS